METSRVCLTCNKDISYRGKQAKYCDSSCYRKDPTIKKKYSDRTNEYQKKHAREINRRYDKLIYKCNFKNYELTILLPKYIELINSGCFYCNSDLLNETGAGLDRLDNNKGYIIDNVVPCCGKCNQIRNVHLTSDEMLVAIKAVMKYKLGE